MKRWLPYQVRTPKSLHNITHIDDVREAAPEDVGLPQRAIDAIWASVEDLYRSGAYPAVGFCLRHHGKVLLNRAIGHVRGNGPKDRLAAPKQLMRIDSPVCLFSASKAVTAILMHKLAEEGGVDLEHRVSHYVPEFAQKGKSQTSIAEVLSHRGGFPMFELPRGVAKPELLLDWEGCIRLICEAEPAHRGAPRMAYHAITGGFILGEIVRRVTGASLQRYLDEKLRQPLGMQHFTFGLPPEHRAAAALNYAAGQPVIFPISRIVEKTLVIPFDRVIEASNSDIFMDAIVPAGNLYATAEELSRFYQMLLDKGSYGGQQVLKPETVRRAVRPSCKLQFDHTLKIPMRYSEGLMLGANPIGIYGPMTGAAFGHLGFMNILGWADPARDIAVGLLVTGKAVLGGHLLALGELLTTISWQCRP